MWSVMLAMWAWERDCVAQHPDPLPEMRHVSCGQNVTPMPQHWFRSPEGPAMVLTHKGCGASFSGETVCDHCLGPVQAGATWHYGPVDERRNFDD